MFGPARIGLMAGLLALAATPALAWPGPSFGYNSQVYADGPLRSGQAYSRSVQVQTYGADYAGRPIDYAPGDQPTDFYPPSSAYEARYDDGYAQSAAYTDAGYQSADYGPASQAPCPQVGGERVVRCVYRPIREEIHINSADFDGGVGVIPSGGGGGGGFVVVGGMASAGARAYASASASARVSVSVRGGGGHRGGGCNCGGGKH